MQNPGPAQRRGKWVTLALLAAFVLSLYAGVVVRIATHRVPTIPVHDLPHVLAVINAATIAVLITAYGRIRARDREGHRRRMMLAVGLGVAFLVVYLVYHASAGLAKFGGYGLIRPIYFTLLAVHVLMAAVVAVLVPLTFFNAMKQRFATHKRLARVTLPAWLFVSASGLVVYALAVHLYPVAAS